MIANKLFTLAAAAMALPLALSACGRDDDADQNLSSLDESLGNVSDPALRGALEDQIIVDPELASRSNANAVRPADRPGTGTGTLPPEVVATQYDAPVGGKLFRAPKAVEAPPCKGCETEKPVTGSADGAQGSLRGKSAIWYGLGQSAPGGIPCLSQSEADGGGGRGERPLQLARRQFRHQSADAECHRFLLHQGASLRLRRRAPAAGRGTCARRRPAER